MSLNDDKNYRVVADKIIEQLKNGTSPWVKPWDVAPSIPRNAATGKSYRGINVLSLMGESRSDPRWMTYNQAAAADYQVKPGSKGTPILVWKTHFDRDKKDASGKSITDANGKKVKESVKRVKPMLKRFTVFNAEQIDRIPPMEPKKALSKIEANERADGILKESGATIKHGGGEAFYLPGEDRIQLPDKEDFSQPGGYYATALHELGHWTGHETRLDRDLSGEFGSPKYATEELRAEIYSFMASAELEIPYDPSQHMGYVEHWIKKLENDPSEIMRASKDANTILDYTLAFDRTLDMEKERELMNDNKPGVVVSNQLIPTVAASTVNESEKPRTYSDTKSTTTTMSSETFSPPKALAALRTVDIQADLKRACESAGLIMKADPVFDGSFHRVPVENASRNNKHGQYKAFSDGRPAAIIRNFHTGAKVTWVAQVTKPLTLSEKRNIAVVSEQKKKQRAAIEDRSHQHKARRVEQLLAVMPKATDNNRYLKTKGIKASDNVYEDKRGRLVVPLTDVLGNAQSIIRINSTGSFKGYMKGAKKSGGMHVIGDPSTGDKVLVAEGYSTAKTVHEATGLPTVAAGDAGNLASVALAVQQAYAEATVFVVGDDDQENDRNIGRDKATQAAKAVGTRAIFPQFGPGQKGSDFNDLSAQTRKSDGHRAANTAVRQQVEKGIRVGRSQEKHQNASVKSRKEKVNEKVISRGR